MNEPMRTPEMRFDLPSGLREGSGVGLSAPSHLPTPSPSRKREGDFTVRSEAAA